MSAAAKAAPTAEADTSKLDDLCYRLRGMGSAVECIGVLIEVNRGDERSADDALQMLGQGIRDAVEQVREEVGRITGKAF